MFLFDFFRIALTSVQIYAWLLFWGTYQMCLLPLKSTYVTDTVNTFLGLKYNIKNKAHLKECLAVSKDDDNKDHLIDRFSDDEWCFFKNWFINQALQSSRGALRVVLIYKIEMTHTRYKERGLSLN